MALLLSACTSSGADSCLLFKPVYVSRKDVFTDLTARAILTNNEIGAKVCGWKKANKSM